MKDIGLERLLDWFENKETIRFFQEYPEVLDKININNVMEAYCFMAGVKHNQYIGIEKQQEYLGCTKEEKGIDSMKEYLWTFKTESVCNTRYSGWQPIETAPKDGRRLLFFRDGYFIVGFWDETNNSWAIPDYPPEPINPTHWMELPEPPE